LKPALFDSILCRWKKWIAQHIHYFSLNLVTPKTCGNRTLCTLQLLLNYCTAARFNSWWCHWWLPSETQEHLVTHNPNIWWAKRCSSFYAENDTSLSQFVFSSFIYLCWYSRNIILKINTRGRRRILMGEAMIKCNFTVTIKNMSITTLFNSNSWKTAQYSPRVGLLFRVLYKWRANRIFFWRNGWLISGIILGMAFSITDDIVRRILKLFNVFVKPF